MFGFNMGSDGVIFDPSITVGTTLRFGAETYESEVSEISYEEDSKSEFPYKDDASVNEVVRKYIDYEEYHIDKISAFDDYKTVDGKPDLFSDYFRDNKGYLHKDNGNGTTKRIGGVTTAYWKGWKCSSTILLSQVRNQYVFTNIINHEITHAYINAYYRTKWGSSNAEFKKFTESSAYTSGMSNIPSEYQNGIYKIVIPPKLLPNSTYLFNLKSN
jgi:hypothetical protein